jgi:hypothetical protein
MMDLFLLPADVEYISHRRQSKIPCFSKIPAEGLCDTICVAKTLRFTMHAASNQREGQHKHDIQPACVASNQLEARYSIYLWHRTRGKVNKIFYLPVALNQFETRDLT